MRGSGAPLSAVTVTKPGLHGYPRHAALLVHEHLTVEDLEALETDVLAGLVLARPADASLAPQRRLYPIPISSAGRGVSPWQWSSWQGAAAPSADQPLCA